MLSPSFAKISLFSLDFCFFVLLQLVYSFVCFTSLFSFVYPYKISHCIKFYSCYSYTLLDFLIHQRTYCSTGNIECNYFVCFIFITHVRSSVLPFVTRSVFSYTAVSPYPTDLLSSSDINQNCHRI